jgi:hypothetical protein
MKPRIKNALVCLLVASFLICQESAVFAQAAENAVPDIGIQKPQPPMENVFFNVLWGSLSGGMLMMGWTSLDDGKEEEERYGVSNMSSQFLTGATYGGLLGLIAGVYISMKGITFDENRTKIAFFEIPRKESFSLTQNQWETSEPEKQPLNLIHLQMKF